MPQQPVELGRRHLGEHALLELEPQPRHRDEQRRPRALQVLQEGVERLGEEDVRVAVRPATRPRPRSARSCAPAAGTTACGSRCLLAQALRVSADDALGGARDGAERSHHALGLAGGARGVDQHRQLVGARAAAGRQRRGARDDGVPGVERRSCGASGKAMHGRPAGTPALLLRPGVELADEQQAGLAVLEHVAHGVGGLGREDRHRGVAGHPDGQLGHEEVRAVLRQDRDARAAREAAALQVRGHAPRLVQHLAPRCSRRPGRRRCGWVR